MSLALEYPVGFAVLCAIFGLIVGSFLNVVVYRVPRILLRQWGADAAGLLRDDDVAAELKLEAPLREKIDSITESVGQHLAALSPLGIALPGSSCPSCGHAITPLENIPIISWLFLRARCSACKTRISARYPIVEGLVAVLFGLVAWQFGATPTTAAALVLCAILVALTLIDADRQLLPDTLTLSLLWIGLLVNLAPFGFAPIREAVIGAVAGYLTFWLVATGFRLLRGIEGMGGGDLKLLAALGAWFGWTSLLPIILVSAGVGSVVGVSLMLARRATMLTRLPFGVYLAPAGIGMLFFRTQILALLLPGGH
jgi:leader peptidase (prepilin peptidase)/N-methyltransferase